MHLTSITLRQFRNHRDLTLRTGPRLNLLVGPNGSGKTNILEAVAVLTTGFSPRITGSDGFLQWGEKGFYISGVFAPDGGEDQTITLEMKFLDGQRHIKRDSQTGMRLKDLIGTVPVVSFFPEDLAVIKGEPELRRRALNLVLMQIDPLYTENLRRYNEALRSRNAALRQLAEGEISEDALEPWDEELIKYALPVCARRSEFLEDFSPVYAQIQERISEGADSAHLEYRPSFPGPWESKDFVRLKENIKNLHQKDIVLGATMAGPHRDDILFYLNQKAARTFGSEGQIRTCALAFKLAELDIIRRVKNEEPICLLDDILSELDGARAECLLSELSRMGQCFVTMTGLESWPKRQINSAVIFHVGPGGQVEEAETMKLVNPEVHRSSRMN